MKPARIPISRKPPSVSFFLYWANMRGTLERALRRRQIVVASLRCSIFGAPECSWLTSRGGPGLQVARKPLASAAVRPG